MRLLEDHGGEYLHDLKRKRLLKQVLKALIMGLGLWLGGGALTLPVRGPGCHPQHHIKVNKSNKGIVSTYN